MSNYWKGILSGAVTVLFVLGVGAIEAYLPELDAAIGTKGWLMIEGALITAGVIKVRNVSPPPADPAEGQTHA